MYMAHLLILRLLDKVLLFLVNVPHITVSRIPEFEIWFKTKLIWGLPVEQAVVNSSLQQSRHSIYRVFFL